MRDELYIKAFERGIKQELKKLIESHIENGMEIHKIMDMLIQKDSLHNDNEYKKAKANVLKEIYTGLLRKCLISRGLEMFTVNKCVYLSRKNIYTKNDSFKEYICKPIDDVIDDLIKEYDKEMVEVTIKVPRKLVPYVKKTIDKDVALLLYRFVHEEELGKELIGESLGIELLELLEYYKRFGFTFLPYEF